MGVIFSLQLWSKSPGAGMCPLPGAEGVGGGRQEEKAAPTLPFHTASYTSKVMVSNQSRALVGLGMNRNTKWDLGRG